MKLKFNTQTGTFLEENRIMLLQTDGMHYKATIKKIKNPGLMSFY